MGRFLHILLVVLFTLALVSANTSSVFASEGDNEHAMKMEVNGYYVTLESQNEWKKGENTIVVTLMDGMGMPVQNADVEILISPKADGHTAAEIAHDVEQGHDSMPGMDMGEAAEPMPAHDEASSEPISMTPSHHEQGMYTVATHLASSGEHEVTVMFHVNGEMLQATFIVDILRSFSKSLVLWGFVAVNVALITSAGVLKKQSIRVKGH